MPNWSIDVYIPFPNILSRRRPILLAAISGSTTAVYRYELWELNKIKQIYYTFLHHILAPFKIVFQFKNIFRVCGECKKIYHVCTLLLEQTMQSVSYKCLISIFQYF
jgi:hypothetical protein